MIPILDGVFSVVCGRFEPHTWAPGGEFLPLCQRCAGLYAGAAAAWVSARLLRLPSSMVRLTLSAAVLLLMIPFGFHWVPQNAVIRSSSGVLFGCALVFLLAAPAAPETRSSRVYPRRAAALVTIAATLAAVPVLGMHGGAAGWIVLTAASVAGLAILAGLAASQATRLVTAIARRARPRTHPAFRR
jgi:hypothetical protein